MSGRTRPSGKVNVERNSRIGIRRGTDFHDFASFARALRISGIRAVGILRFFTIPSNDETSLRVPIGLIAIRYSPDAWTLYG